MAISTTTSVDRRRACPPPALPPRPPSFRLSFKSVRIAANAGARLHRIPVISARNNAKATTIQSRPISEMRGRVSGNWLTHTRIAMAARAMPSTPPDTLSAKLSSMLCRKSAAVLAPNASRTLISRRRRIARTSSSPARLAQAMSSTTHTARNRIRIRGRASATVSSCRGRTTALIFIFAMNEGKLRMISRAT